MQELEEKKKMEEYWEKVKREKRLREKEKEIELERIRECQKALEREAIAKGMKCTKEDEIALRQMQLMQVREREAIHSEEKERDRMWHDVLVNTVRNKEYQEVLDFQRRQQEMVSRRRAYDEQIASANRKREEMIRLERERENDRLEAICRKMNIDREEELKRKKEQQIINCKNFIEEHKLKLSRLQNERQTDRQMDNQTIQIALEELRKQRQKEYLTMKNLQHEKRVFIQNYNREREEAIRMSEERDQAARDWQEALNNKAEEHLKSVEEKKIREREIEAASYKSHLEELKANAQKEQEERARRIEQVRQVASDELRLKMRKACEEYNKQKEYNNNLERQIYENQRVLSSEMREAEVRQRPFTRRPEMFREAMWLKVDEAPGRNSTNPVHPFKRLMEINGSKCFENT